MQVEIEDTVTEESIMKECYSLSRWDRHLATELMIKARRLGYEPVALVIRQMFCLQNAA